MVASDDEVNDDPDEAEEDHDDEPERAVHGAALRVPVDPHADDNPDEEQAHGNGAEETERGPERVENLEREELEERANPPDGIGLLLYKRGVPTWSPS